VPFERRRDEQTFNRLALEQSNAVLRAENERRRCQSIRHHRAWRDHGGTGKQRRVRPRPAVNDVMRPVVADAALVVAGRADRDA